ncbi:aminoglycoside phosphotransferase family protein [Streptomyces jumonjinensis]|uniref:aminoglycoside phosphotransferase family protein n=1 Tax=Streptomyces jumonjinensis TaxID=1945 RepID=UPI0037B00567
MSDDSLIHLLTASGRPTPERERVRVWSMSGVERLTFPDGGTLIFKYARRPFDTEDRALRLAESLGVPVPRVHAATVLDGRLGMLLEDLGTSTREANDSDGVAAAVLLHRAPAAAALPVLDEKGLRALPGRALDHLELLRTAGRWQDTDDIAQALGQISRAAVSRAVGSVTDPFGWVHSEFHPTSVHVGEDGWRLLDFARAFTGPGLLDLASWHGTVNAPDAERLRLLMESYVTAGGTPDALVPRGGLPAEAWSLGWHRMWAVEWFMEQAVRWIDDPATDPMYVKVVRRHLTDVLHFLEV